MFSKVYCYLSIVICNKCRTGTTSI